MPEPIDYIYDAENSSEFPRSDRGIQATPALVAFLKAVKRRIRAEKQEED